MSVFNDIEVLNNFYGVTTTKGDIMVNDGIKNIRMPIGIDKFVITADSTQPYGIKWSDPRFNDITYTQITLLTLPVSTNSSNPVPIDEFQFIPLIGKYMISYDIVFSMSTVISRTAVFGIYVNGILVPNSSRSNTNPTAAGYYNINTQFIVEMDGIKSLCIYYNVSNNDTTINITSGHLSALRFSADLN